MLKGLGSQRLVALFFAGAVALNFPLLALWNLDAALFGLPLFPTALFMLWAPDLFECSDKVRCHGVLVFWVAHG